MSALPRPTEGATVVFAGWRGHDLGGDFKRYVSCGQTCQEFEASTLHTVEFRAVKHGENVSWEGPFDHVSWWPLAPSNSE